VVASGCQQPAPRMKTGRSMPRRGMQFFSYPEHPNCRS
jgi:hypothetical protein